MRRLLICLIGMWFFVSPTQAMEWQMLDEMRQAVQQQDYRGEYLHRRGDQSSVYSIVHRFRNGTNHELLRQLDGDMIEVLRQGDELICYLPADSRNALNHAIPAAPFSQVESLDLDIIAENYKAMAIGSERVAGYQSSIIELRSDDWRYRQKLWLEKSTGFLLQSELLSPNGDVLEQFRFTRLELGAVIEDRELIPTLQGDADVIQQTVLKARPESTGDEGLATVLGWMPMGFELTFAQRSTTPDGWLEQRTFSDGLATVSVFVEQGAAGQITQTGLAKMGATTALMTSRDGMGITVVGEIPDRTARAIAEEVSLASSAI